MSTRQKEAYTVLITMIKSMKILVNLSVNLIRLPVSSQSSFKEKERCKSVHHCSEGFRLCCYGCIVLVTNQLYPVVFKNIHTCKNAGLLSNITQRKKCPYSELLWSTFSRIRTDTPYFSAFSPNAEKCRP